MALAYGKEYTDKLVRKKEYHQKLKKEGILLIHKNVHAKLIVVDNAIVISSSMNFSPESSAGVPWEAGLISPDQQL
jgi:phosphatidylserine/phosphatidylglycerophosphate/cardiolipin synthase-like enzyme